MHTIQHLIHQLDFRRFISWFGRAPCLPVDVLLNQVEKNSALNNNWVSLHQKRLQEAYRLARVKNQHERDRHKHIYDQKANSNTFKVGDHVYLRSHVRGRNKIQDSYKHEIYKIIDQPDPTNFVYIIELTEENGHRKTVNSVELKLVPPELLHNIKQITPSEDPQDISTFNVAPFPQESSSSSSDFDIAVVIPAMEPESPKQKGPRRSQRATKGKHRNPFHLPRSVLSQQQNIHSQRA